ncbi:MAG: hypothetical protein M3P18_20055 [Actinomycetota bacterium]|nr:hypothetical protein [Actinomycetota bacterium]
MPNLLDFLYIDLKRLESFASQLFEGLPSEAIKQTGREAEVGAAIKGGIPMFAEGSGNTKAVFSAQSSVTSTFHHFLVTRVLSELRARHLLLSDADAADDGSFVLLEGRLQILDPRGLAATLRLLTPMMDAVTQLQATKTDESSPGQSPTQRRAEANRRQRQHQSSSAQAKQFKTFADLTEAFGGETVRIRILTDARSIGTAVVERDKFVESLDRLVLRHGYLTGGTWQVLGQVNLPGADDFFRPGGNNFLDLLEQGGVAALQQMTTASVGTDTAWTLTPLAVYREIRGEP